ncbi:MAG: histidine phosphatase family protein [bacterium]
MRTATVIRALAALLVIAPVVARAQSAATGSTTIIVVRHAEKAAEPAADPPLTTAGATRAHALAAFLHDAGVRAVISTQYARTRLTASPTASALRLPVEILDARFTPRATADSLLAKHRGQTMLVVGHSNTVPAIVEALGAPRPADICDAGYDNAFVVTVPVSGTATVVRLHYGERAVCP